MYLYIFFLYKHLFLLNNPFIKTNHTSSPYLHFTDYHKTLNSSFQSSKHGSFYTIHLHFNRQQFRFSFIINLHNTMDGSKNMEQTSTKNTRQSPSLPPTTIFLQSPMCMQKMVFTSILKPIPRTLHSNLTNPPLVPLLQTQNPKKLHLHKP